MLSSPTPYRSIWPISCTISCDTKVKKKNIKKCLFELLAVVLDSHWVTVERANVIKQPKIKKISVFTRYF